MLNENRFLGTFRGHNTRTKSYFGKLFRQCSNLTETVLKLSNKLVVCVLSHIKHSATRRVLYCDKTLLLVY